MTGMAKEGFLTRMMPRFLAPETELIIVPLTKIKNQNLAGSREFGFGSCFNIYN